MKKILLTMAAVICFAATALPERNRLVNQDLTGSGGRAIDTLARHVAPAKIRYWTIRIGNAVWLIKK